MKTSRVLGIVAPICLAVSSEFVFAEAAVNVPLVEDGLSGVVTSAHGPEAGVWVIAQTDDLPTRLIKIVVTDEKGRFVLPELPPVKYKVWVRGYGLVDSMPIEAAPGVRVNLNAAVAPDPKSAAQYYPANYWYSLIETPAKDEFPGTGIPGNGIGTKMKTQQHWLALLKDGCVLCHQLGDKPTREPANTSEKGWKRRIATGRPMGDRTVGDQGPGMAAFMVTTMADFGVDRGIRAFADWSKRIAAGEIPAESPARPSGLERNLVITEWDQGHGHFMHDVIATDRRDPTVNGNGPIVGTGSLHGYLEVFDPGTLSVKEISIGREPHDFKGAYPHTLMMDAKRRVWDAELAARFWPIPTTWPDQPEFCTNGELSRYARYFPLPGKEDRAIYMHDLQADRVTRIPNCYGLHHLQFGYDKDNTLYFSGDGDVIGWINTRVWDETKDPAEAEGWCPLVLDTNGRRTDGFAITPDRNQWNAPGQPVDSTRDTRISVERFLYGIDTNPKDNSIWAVNWLPSVPSRIIRLDLGKRPPESCVTEMYEPPQLPNGDFAAFGARGISIDSNGIAWIAFHDGHLGRFDRNKCKVTKGPTATGQQCPEGWELFTTPGPAFKGIDRTHGNADYLYQSWVDRHDVLYLGRNTPIVTGTMSDSLLAFIPDKKEFLTFRVPYPMGFYTRWLDGRIDDVRKGWKGRGYWATYSTMTNWNVEGNGEEYGPHLVKFQLRPDPLAH